ncbi:hypothetical protein RJT34_25868 [Clitoria ternatea]|uniref:Uncharacterized protein n=1 Tax=Clitoria ternatea TaxID=43366 RepID=A0AAN9FTC4_CLITE
MGSFSPNLGWSPWALLYLFSDEDGVEHFMQMGSYIPPVKFLVDVRCLLLYVDLFINLNDLRKLHFKLNNVSVLIL